MSNTKQTAVDQLWEQLPKEFTNAGSSQDLYIQIKEVEYEQIMDAFVAGDERGTGEIPFNAEQYYTQTYSRTESPQTTQTFKGEFVKGENGNLIPKNHGK